MHNLRNKDFQGKRNAETYNVWNGEELAKVKKIQRREKKEGNKCVWTFQSGCPSI